MVEIIRENGLEVYGKKMKIFHTKVRFLWYEIYQETIVFIQRLTFINKLEISETD